MGKQSTIEQLGVLGHPLKRLSYEEPAHRALIGGGTGALAAPLGIDTLRSEPLICNFDELQRHPGWRELLSHLLMYRDQLRLVVTRSRELGGVEEIGKQLLGNLFPYRMHPLSVAELADLTAREGEIQREPVLLEDRIFDALLRFGGFPAPLWRHGSKRWKTWSRRRFEALIEGNIAAETRIRDRTQLAQLATLLEQQAGCLTNYQALARQVGQGVSVDTLTRWVGVLESFYHCFRLRPWSHRIPRSLQKQPRTYLYDWSQASGPDGRPDPQARARNLIASALLKAVHFWNDLSLGTYDLYYLQDKQRRQVDFLVARFGEPWFLVHVAPQATAGTGTSATAGAGSGPAPLSRDLDYFQHRTGAQHAFQVDLDLPFVERDCFEIHTPVIVPARTFLAQLV